MFGWLFTLFSWLSSLLGTLFWVALFAAGCFVVFFTLKSDRLTDGYKYGIISAIGLLSYTMIYIRLVQGGSRSPNVSLFSLNSYYYKKGNSHSQIQETFEFRSAYEDHNGGEVDIARVIDKKRYFTVWETPANFEFTDAIVDYLDKKGTRYLYADFSILADLESKHTDKVYFWGLFAQSLIAHFQHKSKPRQITIIFDRLVPFNSPKGNEVDVKDWEYFSDILATLYRKLDYVNIFVITESSAVMDALEATSLSRVSTFKRINGFHKEKLQGFVANYINSNMPEQISAEMAARYAVNITHASASALGDVVKL